MNQKPPEVTPLEAVEGSPRKWGSVTVGYNQPLKLDMDEYGTWEAIRALYWGQINADNHRGFERIEIVPWPEDKK